MQCEFVDVNKNRCNTIYNNISNPFCKLHEDTLQARLFEPKIFRLGDIDYVLKNNVACAHMSYIKNLPLSEDHVKFLNEKNIEVHPSIKKIHGKQKKNESIFDEPESSSK